MFRFVGPDKYEKKLAVLSGMLGPDYVLSEPSLRHFYSTVSFQSRHPEAYRLNFNIPGQ